MKPAVKWTLLAVAAALVVAGGMRLMAARKAQATAAASAAASAKAQTLVELAPTDVVTAQVVGKTTNEFFRMMRVTLDRSSPAIVPNLPVLAPDGVVGTTLKVAGDTVDVRLVADAGAGVDVIVQRTEARGFVRGTGDERAYSCNVEYLKRTDEVDIGDVLVTSGVGLRFPKGIPVCTVTKVTKRDFGVYQQVGCAPTVDFSRLDEVLVVLGARDVIPPPAKDSKAP